MPASPGERKIFCKYLKNGRVFPAVFLLLFSAAAEPASTALGLERQDLIRRVLLHLHGQDLAHMKLADRLSVGYEHPVGKPLYLIRRFRDMYGDGVSVIHGAEPFAAVAAVDDPGLHDAAPLGVAAALLELYTEGGIESADQTGRDQARGKGRDDKLLLVKAGIEIVVRVLLPL